MNNVDPQYLALCRHILENGAEKDDRTGIGTLSIFGTQLRFDLSEGFPLLTTKHVPFRIVAEELLWFLRGETDIKPLLDRGVNIWNADAYRDYQENHDLGTEGWLVYDSFVDEATEDGYNLGPIYGAQWRSWQPAEIVYDPYWDDGTEMVTEDVIDQIANVIQSIRTNPDSRRHIVSAWNVGELNEMALPPCHVLFQFYVTPPSSEGEVGKLSCQLYQRSADVFLGLPFNIASYSLLTHMISDICDLEVGEFIHTIGDAHIYRNHIEQVKTQLKREPRELPRLTMIEEVDDPADYRVKGFELNGYNPHPAIKGKVSVG